MHLNAKKIKKLAEMYGLTSVQIQYLHNRCDQRPEMMGALMGQILSDTPFEFPSLLGIERNLERLISQFPDHGEEKKH